MGLADIASLLQASMGLSAESIGAAAIDRAVQERLAVCSLGDLHGYLECIRESASELQALIEAVVVAETWFFRDRQAFTALARLTHEEWLTTNPEGVVSLLSLPCSTGEEPFSMAMALLDANVPADRFRIDAVDISTRSLAQGMRAVYGKNSFRGHELEFRDRHCEVTPEGYRVTETVRGQVRFQQGNLFATDLLPGRGIYDAIFCRNVLIYFDRPAQDRALAVLDRLLRPSGVLFVAPAETALPATRHLVSTRDPLAFAFRRVGVVPLAPKRNAAPLAPPARRRPPAAAVPVRRARAASETPAAAPPAAEPPAQAADSGDLTEATRLADRGHFVEAARCCEEHLRRHGPSVAAFHFMGLLRDATGNHAEAATYYRKALYLDAKHYDSQIHLALLMEKQGDRAAAQVLRNRARRLEHRGKDE